jgi:hypothetical protein
MFKGIHTLGKKLFNVGGKTARWTDTDTDVLKV